MTDTHPGRVSVIFSHEGLHLQRGSVCQNLSAGRPSRYRSPLHPLRGSQQGGRPRPPPSGGQNVHGYTSNPDRLLDDRFACAWTLRTGLYPANADERNLFPHSFTPLRKRFPYLKIKELLVVLRKGLPARPTEGDIHCPYQSAECRYGQVVNVGRTLRLCFLLTAVLH